MVLLRSVLLAVGQRAYTRAADERERADRTGWERQLARDGPTAAFPAPAPTPAPAETDTHLRGWSLRFSFVNYPRADRHRNPRERRPAHSSRAKATPTLIKRKGPQARPLGGPSDPNPKPVLMGCVNLAVDSIPVLLYYDPQPLGRGATLKSQLRSSPLTRSEQLTLTFGAVARVALRSRHGESNARGHGRARQQQTQRQRLMSRLRHERRLMSRHGVSGAGRVTNCPGTAPPPSRPRRHTLASGISPIKAAGPRPCNAAAPKDPAFQFPELIQGGQTQNCPRTRTRPLLFQDRRREGRINEIGRNPAHTVAELASAHLFAPPPSSSPKVPSHAGVHPP